MRHETANLIPLPEAASGAPASIFTVFVQDETYGLPVSSTQTIFKAGAVTRVPLGPAGMLGLVNFRGKVIVAVSLRNRLGLEPPPHVEGSFAITVELENDCAALIVDRIGDALVLNPADRLSVPQHIDPRRVRFIADLYRCGSILIPVLNVNRLCDLT